MGHQCENYSAESLATTIHYYTYYLVGAVSDRTTEAVAPLNNDSSKNFAATVEDNDNIGHETARVNNHSYTTQEIVEFIDRPREETAIALTNPRKIANSTADELTNKNLEAKNIQEQKLDEPIADPDSQFLNGISGQMLSLRLDVELPTVGRNHKKGIEHFANWSKELDPDRISWQFLKRGRLDTIDSNRPVNIYVPIAPDRIPKPEIQSQVTAPTPVEKELEPLVTPGQRKNKSGTTAEQLKRLKTIASSLNLNGDDPTAQLSSLLDWVETQIKANTEQPKEEDSKHTAIETIAEVAVNLQNLIVPLTQLAQQAIDTESNSRSDTVADEKESHRITPVDTPSLEAEQECQSQDAGDDRLEQKLSAPDIVSTIDALNTAITLKKAAISKEKKRRAKANQKAIQQWQNEIESLARSLDFLESS